MKKYWYIIFILALSFSVLPIYLHLSSRGKRIDESVIYLLLTTLLQLLITKILPFSKFKTYNYNQNVFTYKSVLGSAIAWSITCSFCIIFFITPDKSNNDIFSILGIMLLPILYFAPVIAIKEEWKAYNLENFPIIAIGHIKNCVPQKVITQDEHYKYVGMGSDTNVSIQYEYEGKQYNFTLEKQPNKIFYTFERNDSIELTISVKNPQIYKLNRYLFNRAIDQARYDKYNYGTYIDLGD